MRMSAYVAPSSVALVSAASANALFTASTSAAAAASRSSTHGASVAVPSTVEAILRKSRRITPRIVSLAPFGADVPSVAATRMRHTARIRVPKALRALHEGRGTPGSPPLRSLRDRQPKPSSSCDSSGAQPDSSPSACSRFQDPDRQQLLRSACRMRVTAPQTIDDKRHELANRIPDDRAARSCAWSQQFDNCDRADAQQVAN